MVNITPSYKYITADFLTGNILAEIPATNVTYQRGLKTAGSFSGTVPIMPGVNLTELYNNTLPGKTALYVLRDNVCVWGGLIWSRDYDLVNKTLQLNASEFPSYFTKRLIWKTYDYSFDGFMLRNYNDTSGKAKITLPSNDRYVFMPGSSFQTQYSDPYTSWGRLRNYVAANPLPTNDSTTQDMASVAKVISKSYGYNFYYSSSYSQVNITNATYASGFITYTFSGYTGSSIKKNAWVNVVVAGTYFGVTNKRITAVTIYGSTGTFKVASSSVSGTFSGSATADIYYFNSASYHATLQTDIPHGLSYNQTANVVNVDHYFDGANNVKSIPDKDTNATKFSYPLKKAPDHNIAQVDVDSKYNTTITTTVNHYLVVDSHITISGASGTSSTATSPALTVLNGDYIVTKVIDNKSFVIAPASGHRLTKSKTYKVSTISSGGSFGKVALQSGIEGKMLSKVSVTKATATGDYTFTFIAHNTTGLIVGQRVGLNFNITDASTANFSFTDVSVNITAVTSTTFTVVITRATMIAENSNNLLAGTSTPIDYSLSGLNTAYVQIIPETAVSTNVPDYQMPSVNPSATILYVQSSYKIIKYEVKNKSQIILTLADPNHNLNLQSQIWIRGLVGTNASKINNNNDLYATDGRALGYTVTDVSTTEGRSILTIEYGSEAKNLTNEVSATQSSAYIEVFPNTVQSSKFWGQPSGMSGITVIAQVNAYEYVRTLLKNVLNDFNDYQFANIQIAPGVILPDVAVKSYTVADSPVANYKRITLTTDSTTSSAVTNATTDGTTITYTANNAFYVGQTVNITGIASTNNPSAVADSGFNISNAVVSTANTLAFTVSSALSDTKTSVSGAYANTITNRHKFVAGQQITVHNVGIDESNKIRGNQQIISVVDTPTLNQITYDVPLAYISYDNSGNKISLGNIYNASPSYKKIYFNKNNGYVTCTIRFTGSNKATVDSAISSSSKIEVRNVDHPDAKYKLFDNTKITINSIIKNSAYTDISYFSRAKGISSKKNYTPPAGYNSETVSHKFSQTKFVKNDGGFNGYAAVFFLPNITEKSKIGFEVGDLVSINADSNTNGFYDTIKTNYATVLSVDTHLKDFLGNDTPGAYICVAYPNAQYISQGTQVRKSQPYGAKKFGGTIERVYASLSNYSAIMADYYPRLNKVYSVSANSYGEFPNNAGMGGLSLSNEAKISNFVWDATTGVATITTDRPHNFYKDSILNNASSLSQSGTLVTLYTAERHTMSIGDLVSINVSTVTGGYTYSGTYSVSQVNSPQNTSGPWFIQFTDAGSRTISQRNATGIVNANRSSVTINVSALPSDTPTTKRNIEFLNGRYVIYGQTSANNQIQVYKPEGASTGNYAKVNSAYVDDDGTVAYFTDGNITYDVGDLISVSGITGTDGTNNFANLNFTNLIVTDSDWTPEYGGYFRVTYTPSITTGNTYDVSGSSSQTLHTNKNVTLTDAYTFKREIIFDSGLGVANDFIQGSDYTVVADHLDTYSNFVDGFEYRIDSYYNTTTNKFENTFVFVPNNFYNSTPWTVSSPSRFGADKIQFDYPGNIATISMSENAETAITRQFVMGDQSTGDQGSSAYSSAASANDLLANNWPILETSQKITWPIVGDAFTGKAVNNVDNWGNSNPETDLYKTARRYLTQARPPMGSLSVTVHGNLFPNIGVYSPGDWCVINVNNKTAGGQFFTQRLNSGLEPRSTTFVRKIDGYSVQVPNNPAQPEIVTLELLTDWLVDRFQSQIEADFEVVKGVYR